MTWSICLFLKAKVYPRRRDVNFIEMAIHPFSTVYGSSSLGPNSKKDRGCAFFLAGPSIHWSVSLAYAPSWNVFTLGRLTLKLGCFLLKYGGECVFSQRFKHLYIFAVLSWKGDTSLCTYCFRLGNSTAADSCSGLGVCLETATAVIVMVVMVN